MENRNPIQWAILPLKKYATFRGRAPRAEYWWYILFVAIVGLILGMIDFALFGPILGNYYGPLGLTFTLACAVPGLAVLVRRMHDVGRSGWWALIRVPTYLTIAAGASPFNVLPALEGLGLPTAILVIGVLAYLILGLAVFLFAVTEGYGGANDYGPDPYGAADELEEVFA